MKKQQTLPFDIKRDGDIHIFTINGGVYVNNSNAFFHRSLAKTVSPTSDFFLLFPSFFPSSLLGYDCFYLYYISLNGEKTSTSFQTLSDLIASIRSTKLKRFLLKRVL